jgi:DNA-binding NtrC family response regulator
MKNEFDGFDGLANRLLGANIPLQDCIGLLERSMITAALALHRGNLSAASKHLSVHRNTLQRKVQEYGLTRKPAVREARDARTRRRRTGTD